jgi:hypothetical protein
VSPVSCDVGASFIFVAGPHDPTVRALTRMEFRRAQKRQLNLSDTPIPDAAPHKCCPKFRQHDG